MNAADIGHAHFPIGPAGKPTEFMQITQAMLFKYSKFPNAGKEYLRFMWEQEQFNAVDHHIRCHIHFRRGATQRRRAFTYDWRLWTLPELRELLAQAGFKSSAAYIEGWDEGRDEGNGVFRRSARFDNDLSWVAYVVAYA